MLKTVRFFSNTSKGLIIEPLSGSFYEPTKIYGDGFRQNEKLTIRGRLVCKEEDFDYTSIAHINTDDRGCFDLSNTQSVGGTYTGVEKMGLFWSMKGNVPVNFKNASRPMHYTFSLFKGHIETFENLSPLIQCSAERYIVKKGVTRKEVDVDGIKGTLYIPEGKGPFAAAVTMHGGVKHKHVIEDYAAIFADQGLVMLALAFYGVDGLNKSYFTQPLNMDYFKKALQYLESVDKVSPHHIGVIGSSKGGDIALSMSSFFPQIKFCLLFNANVSSAGTSTVFENVIIPKLPDSFQNVEYISNNVVSVIECLENPRNYPETIVPFTKSNADTLLIVSEKDKNWKSSLYADIYEEKMLNAGKANFKILRYPNLGHIIMLLNAPMVTIFPHPLFPKETLIDFGGDDNLFGYYHDLIKVWHNVFDFLNKHKPYLSKL